MVSTFSVHEIRVQKHVFVDSTHEAVHVGSHLPFALHQRDHDVKSLRSVSREISPVQSERIMELHVVMGGQVKGGQLFQCLHQLHNRVVVLSSKRRIRES